MRILPSINTTPPAKSSQWCSICPPYGVDSMNHPNLTHGRPSEGVGRGQLCKVLYKSIKKREINLIVLLLVFLTNCLPVVANGGRNFDKITA
jgi:hypothetical protein